MIHQHLVPALSWDEQRTPFETKTPGLLIVVAVLAPAFSPARGPSCGHCACRGRLHFVKDGRVEGRADSVRSPNIRTCR